MAIDGEYRGSHPYGEFEYYYYNGELAAHGRFDNELWDVYTTEGIYIGKRIIQYSEEIYFVNDLLEKDGPYILYDDEENLRACGIFVHNEKEGPWSEIEKDIIYAGSYIYGKKDGDWKKYDAFNDMESIIQYQNGQPLYFARMNQLLELFPQSEISAQIIKFSKDLKLYQYDMFLKSKIFDAFLPYNMSRDDASAKTLEYILNYILKNNIDEFIAKTVIANCINEFIGLMNYMFVYGKTYEELIEKLGRKLYWKPINLEETYYFGDRLKQLYYLNKDGEIQGAYRSWHENGILQGKGFYINNKKNGLWTFYYDNGQLQSAGGYFNDKAFGIWEFHETVNNIVDQDLQYTYYPNGQLKQDFYLNKTDKLNGPYTSWYENGMIYENGTYTNGAKSGTWESYDEYGNLQNRQLYFNDMPIEWETYLPDNVHIVNFSYH